ncbi:DHH family phosphoesterase [Paenibacillus senegalensis]|uniref:DHH family phosphoesterase n=1 Tax=Paenibacillus senegalensis TaxID=1465766 RepID=UPI00028970C9|nr:bifunctional oligoribonuclease/PAP phosphatase NrnA [Paenibacillus senegalensis]
MKEWRNLPYEQMLKAATAFIQKHDRFLIVSHVNPDGDAISSTLAVAYMLKQLGKTYIAVNEDDIPERFRYLWGYEDWLRTEQLPPDAVYDAVISVDCADYARIGTLKDRLSPATPHLNIDHHSTNNGFGSEVLIREEAAATAEILDDLADFLGVTWSKDLADCIYTGLLTDTGGFRYSNTSPAVLRKASRLVERGVQASELAQCLLEQITSAHVQLLQRALSRLAFEFDGKLAWIYVTLQDIAETKASNEDLEGLVNYPKNIEGVETGMLLKEVSEGVYKASLRSHAIVDVAKVAQQFGGGGHKRAAGCTIEGTLQEAAEQLVKEVGLVLK